MSAVQYNLPASAQKTPPQATTVQSQANMKQLELIPTARPCSLVGIATIYLS